MWRSSVKPDRNLVQAQLQAMQEQLKLHGAEAFMRRGFWIVPRNKQVVPGNRITGNLYSYETLIPFTLNRGQRHMEAHLARRNLLLKTRQEGGTTYFQARRLILPAVTEPGIGCLSISQNAEYAQKHFSIARRFYRYIWMKDPRGNDEVNKLNISLKQNLLHTAFSNRRELVFDQIDSQIMLASAEVEESGQGVTLHHVLADEYSRWPGNPEDTLSNVMGALAPDGTLDKVCTANGAVGAFFNDCILAMQDPDKSDAKFHFHPWWWTDDLELDMPPERLQELEADMNSTERKVLEIIHKELEDVSWVRGLNKIAWRREAIKEQRGNFDEKYPEDAYTAFLVSGNQYFDRDVLKQRKLELRTYKPMASFRGGETRFFNPRVPGRRYVIGADTAQGLEIKPGVGDFAAAVVLDVETGEEMAALRARLTPEQMAYDLADLGRHYNNALIAVERNGSGGACILTLQGECKYAAVYKHRDWWRRERKLKVQDFEGFPTTIKTRRVALDFVNRFVLESPELIWDEQFVDEALTFVFDEKGIPRAQEEAHDDTVSARWIAHFVRMVMLGYWMPEQDRTGGKYVSADRLVAEGVSHT